MMKKIWRIFLFPILVIAFLITSSFGFSGNDKKVISKITFYKPDVKAQKGLYDIDVENARIAPLCPDLTEKLTSIRLSPDSNYALGTLFNSKKFTRDLQFVDLKRRKSFNLTWTPDACVCGDGTPAGTFEKYGFSPDSKWIVVTFPDSVDIKSGLGPVPLVCGKMRPAETSIVLIDISRWTGKADPNAIMKIPGDDFPSFSPSGNKMLVPLKNNKIGRKVTLYEIENIDAASKPSMHSYEFPFSNVTQASLASDRFAYIIDGDDLVTFDVVKRSIELKRSLSGNYLASTGNIPQSMPYTAGLSDGLISFGGKSFAFLMPNGYIPIPRNLLEREAPQRHSYSQRLLLVYGNIDSPWFERMDIPPLPAEAYDAYILYHRLFILPQQNGKYAALSSTGWNYQSFRIIDFANREITEPIDGFFAGLSNDGKAVLYIQCGPENDCYKGNNDFTWDTIPKGTKKEAITVNLLKYRNLETGFDTALASEPSLVTEAFFVN